MHPALNYIQRTLGTNQLASDDKQMLVPLKLKCGGDKNAPSEKIRHKIRQTYFQRATLLYIQQLQDRMKMYMFLILTVQSDIGLK